MAEQANTYPQVPADQIPDELREDLAWITPWIQQEYPGGRRVDWFRYGRDGEGNPVFSQLILQDGHRAGWQEGRRLVDDGQMAKGILWHLGIRVDQITLESGDEKQSDSLTL